MEQQKRKQKISYQPIKEKINPKEKATKELPAELLVKGLRKWLLNDKDK